ncbi:MAG: LuxE/PaaK family acyltransferase [Promethearchaeota archaeon]
MIIDDLLEKGKQYFRKENQDEVKKERFNAIVETTRHIFENCNLYRQFCRQKNFDPRRDLKTIDDIAKIPYLTTANFKMKSGRPKELLCVPEDQIMVFTMSSGTSGDPSLIGRDKINLVRFFKMFDFVLEELCDLHNYNWSLFFQPKPERALTIEDKLDKPLNHMGYIFNVANKLPMEKRVYALKLADEESRKKGKLFEFDAETTFGFLNSNPAEKGIGWIGGSIPVIYMTLKNYYEQTGRGFNVGEQSVFVSGGGWKTFSGQSVSPDKFRADMEKILGIPQNHIFDVYSFTETDCVHAECEYHNKHVLPWQDVIVRDVETLEPVETGEKGLINVINPIAYSYAGVSILQDDIVRVVMEDECPCGRKGKVIEIFGRAEGAEAKGCGAQIAEETKN